MRDDDLLKLRNLLQEIKSQGWIANQRPGNVGGIGNTLEDLLDVAENNLQLPDFGTTDNSPLNSGIVSSSYYSNRRR